MRTLDHSLTQGSPQWGPLLGHPTCRQLPTHLQIQGLVQGWDGLPGGSSVGRMGGHPRLLKSVIDGKSLATTSLVNRKLSLRNSE